MVDPTLEALWKNVLEGWDNDAAHALFLQHCQASEQLAEAASRYAAMRADPARAEKAKKKLEGVAFLATSSLLAARSDRLPPIPRWFTMAVLFVCTAVGGYILLRAIH